jgi:hypothetical protein
MLFMLLLAVVINKYLPPTFHQKGGKYTLLHTYTCDNTLFPVVPPKYQKCRNKDRNRQKERRKCAFWKAHKGEERK